MFCLLEKHNMKVEIHKILQIDFQISVSFLDECTSVQKNAL